MHKSIRTIAPVTFVTLLTLLAGIAWLSGTASAQDKAAAKAPEKAAVQVTDVLKDAIDPYMSGKERSRFLKAAKVDTELDETEFKANLETKKPFVRKFDKWSSLLLFDRNKDKKIDWFEANNYRKGLRQAMLIKYDKDGNKKLNDKEREAANKDLARGRVPRPVRTADAAGNVPGPFDTTELDDEERKRQRKELEANWRKGELTDEQVNKSSDDILRDRGKNVEKWDENGDGILDDAERAKAKASDDGKWWLKFDDIGMQHFDEDGDGKLSEAESKAMVNYAEKFVKMGAKWDTKFWDTDGDGEVSDAERKVSEGRLQMVGAMMLPKAMKWGDVDGDGQTTEAEWRMMADRVDNASDQIFKDWTKRYDSNGDGRLNVTEREELIQGVNQDIDARVKRHDKDGDGKLSNAELSAIAEELAGEWGVNPAGQK